MKTKLVLSAIAAAAVAVFSQGTFAQASTPSRAEVKAEAKTSATAPTGEAQTMSKQPSTMSDKTRAERKSTTKAAAKAGEIPDAGEKGEMQRTKKPSTSSNTTRAERNAKTKAATKAGEIPDAGEKGSKEMSKKP